MKSSLLNRNSQNGTPAICNAYNTEGWMKSCLPIHWSNSKNPCHRRWSLRRRQCPLFLQCLTLCVESRHNGSHLVNSGRQGQVVDWTLESWKNVLGFHYVFFFQEGKLSHETFVGCLVTAFVLWRDGDFWETTSICLKFFCGNVSSLAYLPESKLENLGQGGRTKANLIVEKPRFRYGSGLKKLKALACREGFEPLMTYSSPLETTRLVVNHQLSTPGDGLWGYWRGTRCHGLSFQMRSGCCCKVWETKEWHKDARFDSRV